MHKIMLLTLAASLSFSLLLKIQNRWLVRKNKRLLNTILSVVCEARGSTKIDESTMRIFAVNQPHHKRAIELLIKEGMVEHHASGSSSIDARVEMGVA